MLDEMIGPRVADELRARHLQVLAVVQDTELRALPDEALLEHAHEGAWVLVTRNVSDFARLHQQWQAAGRRHAGLVLVTERAFPQNRNLVGALVTALVTAGESSELPAPGEVLYLRPSTAGS